METQAIKREVVSQLKRATRYGLHSSAATRSGLALVSVHRGFSLSLEAVEQVVRDVSSVDVSDWVERLYVERVEKLPLDPVTTFKLRAALLLGLDAARYLSPEERRLALVRTYRVNPLLADDPKRGVFQFRNQVQDLFRSEREQLIDEISERIATSIEEPALSSGLSHDAETPRNSDDYRIVEYDDQHVYPANVERRRLVTRRRKIRALRDGVTQFRQQYTVFTSWGVTPVVRFVGVGNFAIERMRPHEVNGERGYIYDLVIDFPPMAKDTSRVLQWIVEFEQDAAWFGRSGVQHIDIRPSKDIDYATIAVRFEAPLAPARCWRFEDIEIGDVRLEEAATAEVLAEAGVFRGEWTNLRTGDCCTSR